VNADPRLVRALVACYPARWRRRYGEEYAQLLCDLRVHRRPLLVLDSLGGAVRAYGGALMGVQSPMTVLVWAAGLFTLAGIGFAKLAEDVTDRAGGWYVLLVAAAAATLLSSTAAASPSAITLVRRRDTGAGRYAAVPVIGAVTWYGMVRLGMALASGHEVHSVANVTAFALIASTGIAVVVSTAWAVAAVLRRAPVAPSAGRFPRLRPVAMTSAAAGMGITTVAALIWGVQVRAGEPAGWNRHHGLVATPFAPSWVVVVVAFAAATALAVLASRRELAVRR
jgi:hypothetical protein